MKIWVYDSYTRMLKGDVRGCISPHYYNAWVLCGVLRDRGYDVEFVCGRDLERKVLRGERCDVIVISYLSNYMPFEVLEEVLSYVDLVVLFFNEYDVLLSVGYEGFRRVIEGGVGLYVVVNFELDELLRYRRWGLRDLVRRWWMVNLNVLRYDEGVLDRVCGGFMREGVVYYGGSFREGRRRYFLKYLNDERVVVSTSKKNWDRWREAGVVRCKFIDRLSWGGVGKLGVMLSNFESSIYLEDEITHRVYNYLANRFYEGLSYGVGVWFVEECRGTVERAVREEGYYIDDWWFVSSTDEIFRKLESKEFYERREEFLNKNREVVRGLRGRVLEQLVDVFDEILGRGGV